jgi:hypothetical protein
LCTPEITREPKKSEMALTIAWQRFCNAVNNHVTRFKDMPAKQHPSGLRLCWHILDVVAHQRESLGAYLEVPTTRADKGEMLGTTALTLHALSVSGLPQTRHPVLW